MQNKENTGKQTKTHTQILQHRKQIKHAQQNINTEHTQIKHRNHAGLQIQNKTQTKKTQKQRNTKNDTFTNNKNKENTEHTEKNTTHTKNNNEQNKTTANKYKQRSKATHKI